MTPTDEQLACIEAARDTQENLLISALAGAAKTTTLVMIAEAIPKTEILCLAFNKKIATEMQQRLPTNCSAMTLNSLGHRAWSEAIGHRLKVDAAKNYNILKELVERLGPEDKSAAYAEFATILRAIAAGKTCGWVPEHPSLEKAKRLMTDNEFFEWLDEEPTDLEWELIREASIRSIKKAQVGEIDYDDQILMPTVFQAFFPRFPLILVDEAQDLSALNHAMLRKLVRKRIIAVGDECQSIYGFRGAHQDSMNLLKKEFEMRELTLSTSFRCPEEIVDEARWRAPHMQAWEGTPSGEISRWAEWKADDLAAESAVLCRNNSPLFAMAIKLLKNGRYPQLVNSDVAKSLTKTMKKFGSGDMRRDEVFDAIDKWQKKKERKARSKGAVADQAECMRIFARQGRDLSEAIAYAEHLLARSGPVQLMTVHRSKGLEFDHVYILDRELIRVAEHQQERNLLYVAQTRSKRTLTYINSEVFLDNAEAHDAAE